MKVDHQRTRLRIRLSWREAEIAERGAESPVLLGADAKGGRSMVTIVDVNQSNGVINIVDSVLMPAS